MKILQYYLIPKGNIVPHLRLALWISKWSDNTNLKNRAITSAAILFFLFVTDIHRSGTWYTGNAAYIKPYWFWYVCLLWFFIGFYVVSKAMHWLKERGQFGLAILKDIIALFKIETIIAAGNVSYKLMTDNSID